MDKAKVEMSSRKLMADARPKSDQLGVESGSRYQFLHIVAFAKGRRHVGAQEDHLDARLGLGRL
jgi:hypothetical protein